MKWELNYKNKTGRLKSIKIKQNTYKQPIGQRRSQKNYRMLRDE
jgi:hypothetical protein